MGIDWSTGPVKLDELEQINLTRDDLIHNIDVTTQAVYKNERHAERYPEGLFTDEMWRQMAMPRKIKVGREELSTALQIVDSFCGWLEDIRLHYKRYLESLPEARRRPEAGQ
jgi:DNA-binding XRE family transcriptional regulator